ncbi:hypothetical protein BABINDRAFT_162450 [Babjeviella inositovora NRRL Y-12698]|uniref:Phospholipid-transporting ATPase n=1 Tax=Babjeviella inositovora NRRL Y-12698 TaxID=984486 RepID=A0A1E3QM38_9ASCO|nr:uncharacterized protein BABINDRAFT_162450 [Babjeviella inositovora NRRL Y-12698]ODQ78763.1 hypothetical protein BABINDRAFT_162450 [Babjeviella inositovora NRRL Y-12698]
MPTPRKPSARQQSPFEESPYPPIAEQFDNMEFSDMAPNFGGTRPQSLQTDVSDMDSIMKSPVMDTFEFETGPYASPGSSRVPSGPGLPSRPGPTKATNPYRQTTPKLSDAFERSIEYSEEPPDASRDPPHIQLHLPDNHTGHEGDTMKRHRWGTQRTKKGKPAGMARSKTLRWKRQTSQKPLSRRNSTDHVDEDESDDENDRKNELRTIYFNLPLPDDLLDPSTREPVATYPRNKVRTTKYTPLSFVPKNLAFQFKNVANVYFLILIVMGFFSIFGVPNPAVSAVPLIVIVVITAVKDAIEDSRRTLLDAEVNNTPTHILQGVENANTSDDNISAWRRFKKACTRGVVVTFRYFNGVFTKDGRVQRTRDKEEAARKDAPRKLFQRDSFDSYMSDDRRKSFQMADLSNPFTDSNAVNTILDPSLPLDTSVRFRKLYWKSVKVGDIVRIHNNDEIPADVAILATSDADGACYVETKNLDGETNLKVRQALKCGGRLQRAADCSRMKFWLESEGPHANLYSYQGNLKWERGEVSNEAITINNMLLRGCSLRNTKWAVGIVVFTGTDTKIVLNAGITPTKRSRITRELNVSVLLNFVLLFVICFVSGIVNGVYYARKNESRQFYEFGDIANGAAANGIVGCFVAVILYQSLVPISLYISIEIIKTAQAFFIYSDVLMYYARLDYPCTPKSWNISDDLGQIEYIFSDKTGTLTQNVMEYKKCTINGITYGRAYTEALAGMRKRQGIDVESEGARERELIRIDKDVMLEKLHAINRNPQLTEAKVTFVSSEYVDDLNGAKGGYQQKCNEHFMLTLALCHSVIAEPSKTDPDKLVYKAQSPDEAALVGTARDTGFTFLLRTKKGLVVNVQGEDKEYQILNTLEFNSTRKRMSAIVKIPSANPSEPPKALLICKGADSIIYSRLRKDNDQDLLERTALHLEEFATEGLRTLCIAQRELSWTEYEEWNRKHEIALAAITKREEKMEEVADSIERELILLGGTAIEDRLQDGVPDSIAILGQAGIKLWVLTGDKVETAINIGFSCNLLGNDMELLVIKTEGEDIARLVDGSQEPKMIVDALITKYLAKFQLQGSMEELVAAKGDHTPPNPNFGVVIDGDALKLALQGETQRKFLLLCKQCKAVLCCRVSPAQKAAVVKMVKETLDVMTLAIGDGSNDVAMIQAADVGVGIAGEEGRQAVMSSDYAIGQFRFLTRLILVHGRWSYKRLSEMVPCFFYKNVIFSIALFWYGIYNDFDGSYLFEYTYLMFYNLAFTSIPVVLMGIVDQDVSDVVSLLVPQLYKTGILRSEWTITKFWWYMGDGLYQSVISFYFPYLCFYKGFVGMDGLTRDHRFWMGMYVATIAAAACNIYILFHQYRWDWLLSLLVAVSILLVFGWTGVWTSFTSSQEFYNAASQVYGSASFWVCLFVGIMACILPRFAYDFAQKLYFPKDVDIVRECVARGDFAAYPLNYDPTDPDRVKISDYSRGKSMDAPRMSMSSDVSSMVTATVGGTDLNITRPNRSTMLSGYGSPSLFETYGEGFPEAEARTSLERTRRSMAEERGPMRRSMDRPRTSLEIPSVTTAVGLIKTLSNGRQVL